MTQHAKEAEVQDAEFKEVEPAAAEVTKETRCEVTVGLSDDGSIYFNIGGTDQSLINIEGLLAYGKRYIDGVWAERLKPADK